MSKGVGGGCRRRSTTCLIAALVMAACAGAEEPGQVGVEVSSPAGEAGVTAGPSSTGATSGTQPSGGPVVIETIPGANVDEVSAVTERIAISETVYYAGFEIEVLEVIVGFDPSGFRFAEAVLALTNRTPSAARLNTSMEIVSAAVVAPLFRDGTPEVEPGATLPGTVGFRLGEDFNSADAVLIIGRVDLNRAKVPLGTSGELVALLPVDLGVTASTSDDTTSISITSMVLSWDSTDIRAHSAPGEVFVRIEYSLDSAVDTALSDDVVRLRVPSGEHVAPQAESSQRIDAGVAVDGLFASFMLTDADAAELVTGVVPPGFVFVYTERFDRGVVEVPLAVN